MSAMAIRATVREPRMEPASPPSVANCAIARICASSNPVTSTEPRRWLTAMPLPHAAYTNTKVAHSSPRLAR